MSVMQILDGSVEEPQNESQATMPAASAVIVGALIGFRDDGRTPLVIYPGQPGPAAQAARTAVDVHGAHVGRHVVLSFEQGDPRSPIIMGWLRASEGWPLPERPGQVRLTADGERLTVSARNQLVLQCGEASITLSSDGRIAIRGKQVVSHADGVNRVRGGSVQLN